MGLVAYSPNLISLAMRLSLKTVLLYGAASHLGEALARTTTVKLDKATVIGSTDGVVSQFLGIPFAQPPVGKLRLQLPQPIPRFTGVINGTALGNQCIQQTLGPPPLPSDLPPRDFRIS
ncbi:Alpha/Beta hydrolase protein [Trametes meyenii]|nr:Alpha/Beta hydrolase protein [Trametes meyenii]